MGPPVGGTFGFKFSSRPPPRKFGVKRFLVVREVAGAVSGWPVFGLPPLEKIIGGVIAIISFRPGGCSSLPVQNRSGALLVDPDPLFTSRRAQLVAHPPWNSSDFHIARIRGGRRPDGLRSEPQRGEHPADLPVVQPTKFEFVINLMTAKPLSLNISQ